MDNPTGALGRLALASARGVGAACNLTGACGIAREAAWVAAHVATYPLGLVADRHQSAGERVTLDRLTPLQRALLIGDVEAAGTPILLVHGLADNRSVFSVLRRQLRRRGFGRIATMNYSVFTGDVRAAAERLRSAVERLCEETGYDRIHLVGHSLGGLVGRYYVQRMGGHARVHTLVTLGTPHEGTAAARLLPHRLCRQIRPDGALIEELRAPAPGVPTRFVAVWSDLDQLIAPKTAARVDHPDLRAANILVRGVGHMSLPIHGAVVRQIASVLAHLDPDGGTLSHGVTSIEPDIRPAGRSTRRRDGSSCTGSSAVSGT